MQEPSNIRHEVAAHIKSLPAEQVKLAMLKWLDDEGELEDLEQQLEQSQNQLTYGTVDEDNNFTPLTEETMIDLSLEALEGYKKSDRSIPQESMQEWANSLGTDDRLSCPQ